MADPLPEDRSLDEIGELTRAFARMQSRLRGQEAARRSFVATASHELRTPLASLDGMLELLEDDLDPGQLDLDDARERTASARDQTRTLTHLASDLLDLSRLDAEVELRNEPLELGELCRAVAAELELDAARRHVAIHAPPPPEPCWAQGDPGAVARIVRILLDNALRVAPADSSIELESALNGPYASLTVRDRGPGVAPSERSLIFERFQRGFVHGRALRLRPRPRDRAGAGRSHGRSARAGRNGDAGRTGDAGRNGDASRRRVSPRFGRYRRSGTHPPGRSVLSTATPSCRNSGRGAQYMSDSDVLAEIAAQAQHSGHLALDTEFMGEGRYRTLLCLVQLAVPDHTAGLRIELVDPLLESLDGEPLAQVLADPAVELVVHSGRQDIALLRRRFDTPICNIFDTQIAAGFAGMAAQTSYETLLAELLGVRLAKSASFTRWDTRPLTREQLAYAREDVVHLLELASELQRRLSASGRLLWAREECRALEQASDERQ